MIALLFGHKQVSVENSRPRIATSLLLPLAIVMAGTLLQSCNPTPKEDVEIWRTSNEKHQLELFLEEYVYHPPGLGQGKLMARFYLSYDGDRINVGRSHFTSPGITFQEYDPDPVFLEGLEVVPSVRRPTTRNNAAPTICSIPPEVIDKDEFKDFAAFLDSHASAILREMRTAKLREGVAKGREWVGLGDIDGYVWGGRRVFRSNDGHQLLVVGLTGDVTSITYELDETGTSTIKSSAGKIRVEDGRRVYNLRGPDFKSATMVEFWPGHPPPFDGSGTTFRQFLDAR